MNRFAWLVLVLGIVALVLLSRSGRGPLPPAPLPAELRDEPDLYLAGPRIEQFDDDGLLQYVIEARSAAHFLGAPTGDPPETTRFEAPRISFRDDYGLPWTLRAAAGRTLPRSAAVAAAVGAAAGDPEGLIRLEGDVVVVRSGPEARFARIQSRRIDVDPETRFVRSSVPVIIDTPAARSTASAFDGALARGQLVLLSGPEQRVQTLILPVRQRFQGPGEQP